MALNPDDRCLVFNDDEKRGPGQACVCATDCTTGNCDQGVCCVGGACGAKRPSGAACTSGTQCTSGFCADGVCCNVACAGACLACNQAESMGECSPVGAGVQDPHAMCRTDAPSSCGQSGVCNGQGGCAKYPPETICAPGSCNAAGQFIPPSSCDGEGTCVAGVAISCSPSKCIGSECVRVCTSSSQCVAGKTCLSGSCGKFGPGQTCAMNSECDSNFCVDGVCCESACTGTCQSCSNPASRGKCVNTAAGVKDAACPTMPASSCGSNGKCDGKGGCANYDSNTTCRPAKCDPATNIGTLAAKCTNGSCPASKTPSCAPFKGCNGTACLGACGSDSQCSPGNVCTMQSCGKRPIGGKCTVPSDCANNQCVHGYCCNSPCTDTCKSCALLTSPGICTNVPAGGADPNNTCKDDLCTNQCNGKGACQQEPTGSLCGPNPLACSPSKVLSESRCTDKGVCETKTKPCPADCSTTDGCIDAPPVCSPACGPDQMCTTAGCVCNAGKPPKECGSVCVATNACCPGTCDGPCDKCSSTGACEADVNKTCTLPGGAMGKCDAMRMCIACVPKTCAQKGWACGVGSDDCTGNLTCPTCDPGQHCDNHACVPDACVPKTCVQKGWACGVGSDDCSGNLTCPACDSGKHCDNHACVPDACVPKTCATLNWTCGTGSDGCTGTVDCHDCPSGKHCDNHDCVNDPPPADAGN